ncbi:MAG: hypothetical protein OXH57_06205 [Ekhidna sp.]|nr:hypothetical protein [Ekhidna sp.]
MSDFLQKDNRQMVEQKILKYFPDTESYIAPADNFLIYGTFGKENEPSYRRTIGYPLIIYIFKVTLGPYWYHGLVIFQILLGALIYPVAYGIGIAIFSSTRMIFYSIITLILLGGYFTKSMNVLPDLTCASFLLLGVYLSIISVISRKSCLMMCSVIILSFAALIRPNLILYPIVHFLLLLYVAKEHNLWTQIKTKRAIWASSIVLLLMCNLSSLRIYGHYGIFSPTDILGINMFEYSVKEIMSRNEEEEKYLLWESEINAEDNSLTKDKLRKDRFFEAISNHPKAAVSYWIDAAISHLVSPHYLRIGAVYGYYKRNKVTKNHHRLSESAFMRFVFYLSGFLNAIILLLGFLYLCHQVSKKEYLFVLVFLCLIFLIVGPSFLARTGPRVRLPVEPFLLILAVQYLEIKKNRITCLVSTIYK